MSDSEPIHSGDFDLVGGYEPLHNSSMKCIHGVLWKDTPASYFLNNIEENSNKNIKIKGKDYEKSNKRDFLCRRKRP